MAALTGRLFAAVVATCASLICATPGPAAAQTAPDAKSAPGVAATPTTPPADKTPAPATTPAAPGPSASPGPSDGGAGQTIDVASKPAVVVSGAAKWDDGFKTIMEAIGKARAAALKAHLAAAGRPLTAFTDTDDNGFKFDVMVPVEAPPAGAVDLGADAKLGTTPSGKAIKFQHRGAYEEVDSTYEAITAYLDEKGYEARDVFVEEYLNDPKGPDDASLALDIYVFIK